MNNQSVGGIWQVPFPEFGGVIWLKLDITDGHYNCTDGHMLVGKRQGITDRSISNTDGLARRYMEKAGTLKPNSRFPSVP